MDIGRTERLNDEASKINLKFVDSFSHFLLESSPDSTCIFDNNFKLLYTNYFLNGAKVEDVINKNLYEIFREEVCKVILHYMMMSKESGETIEQDATVKESDGSIKNYKNFYKYFEVDGKGYFITRTRDIDKEVLNTMKIESQKNAIIESSKWASLGKLSAGIAHEIKNPLAVIQLICDLLAKKNKDNDLLKTKLKKVISQVEKISYITNGLSSYSRNVEDDKMVEMKLHSIIKESLYLFKSQTNGTKFEIKYENTCKEAVLKCRPGQISQVLINLFKNSFDAIENCESPWIKIEVKNMDGISIRVIDSGKGIEKEVVQRIFDQFFTTKEVGKGTGIGLSLSASIIDEHNGSLNYLPDEKNTTFEIKFSNASFTTH